VDDIGGAIYDEASPVCGHFERGGAESGELMVYIDFDKWKMVSGREKSTSGSFDI
jgi:hypothetical protein